MHEKQKESEQACNKPSVRLINTARPSILYLFYNYTAYLLKLNY